MPDDSYTRRRVIQGGTTTAVLGLLSTWSTPVAGDPVRERAPAGPAGVWTQSGATPANTARGVTGVGPTAPGACKWERSVNGRVTGIAVDRTTVFGVADGTIFATNRRDGTHRWAVTHECAQSGPSAPAITGDYVVVGCPPVGDGENGEIAAYDKTSGAQAWSFEPPVPVTGVSPPAVANGSVYVVGYGVGAGTPDRLYALDGTDGTVQWTHATGPSSIARETTAGVAVGDRTIVVAGTTLQALSSESGSPLWTQTADTSFKTIDGIVPSIDDGHVFLGRHTRSGPQFECRTLHNGALVWQSPLSAGTTRPLAGGWTPAAIDGRTVYVGHRTDDARITMTALSCDTGRLRWQVSLDRARYPISSPAVTKQTLYTGSAAIATADGSIRWHHPEPDSAGPVAITPETVFIGGETLCAFTDRREAY